MGEVTVPSQKVEACDGIATVTSAAIATLIQERTWRDLVKVLMRSSFQLQRLTLFAFRKILQDSVCNPLRSAYRAMTICEGWIARRMSR